MSKRASILTITMSPGDTRCLIYLAPLVYINHGVSWSEPALDLAEIDAQNGARFPSHVRGKEEVKAYERRIADLEQILGQKEIKIALLENVLGGR